MLLLCTFTSVASMFVDNVTTILLMIPVTHHNNIFIHLLDIIPEV
jgi:Na+/H+ antiporter NhaD/arsenite permease-like protein